MTETFKEDFECDRKRIIGENKQLTFQDFTEKLLPEMFGDNPYIRVTYNTDLKTWEWLKKYRQKETQKGIHLTEIKKSNASENIALWYQINRDWIKYCEKMISQGKESYIILSQLKDKSIHFCIAPIIKFYQSNDLYGKTSHHPELFYSSQKHESKNLYGFKHFSELGSRTQTKIVGELEEQKRSAVVYKQPSEIIEIPNITKLDMSLVKDAKFFYNPNHGGIPTVTHSHLPIKVNKEGKISIGKNENILEKKAAQKTLFLLALVCKNTNSKIIYYNDGLKNDMIQKMEKIHFHFTDKLHDERKIQEDIKIMTTSQNLRTNLSNLNKELDKLFCEGQGMYSVHQESGQIKFKYNLHDRLITIDKEFISKIA